MQRQPMLFEQFNRVQTQQLAIRQRLQSRRSPNHLQDGPRAYKPSAGRDRPGSQTAESDCTQSECVGPRAKATTTPAPTNDSADSSHVRQPADIHQTVANLSRQVRALETEGRQQQSQPSISTGCRALDRHLPCNGYEAGTVVEYLRSAPACGASYLAFTAAATAQKLSGGFIVVINSHDARRSVYPPTLAAHGIDLDKVVFVRPETSRDAIWAADQSLRNAGVAAVVAELERVDEIAARRLQLAAESASSLGILLRSSAARRRPSWAEVQWLVTPAAKTERQEVTAHRKIHVQLVRNRGGKTGAGLWLEIHNTTGVLQPASSSTSTFAVRKSVEIAEFERKRHEQKASLHLASKLAHPTRPVRSAAS